jgi:hypothetical protein
MTEIACTLTPVDMPRRAEEIRAIGRDGLLSVERGDGRALLRFRPGARERVEAIVEAESTCCAFLDLALADEEGELVLTIAAPEGGELAVQLLADLFESGRAAA